MQEDFEKQLKSAEDSKIQALEELTQNYEAKLQEKTQRLAQVGQREQQKELAVVWWSSCLLFCCAFVFMQCQEDAQQQAYEFKEIIKQVEEDEERMIHDMQIKYEKKLHTEKETNTNLRGETGIMEQKVTRVALLTGFCF